MDFSFKVLRTRFCWCVCVWVKGSAGWVKAADWACCVIKAGRAQQVKGAAAWGVITQEPCYVWDIGSPPTCVQLSHSVWSVWPVVISVVMTLSVGIPWSSLHVLLQLYNCRIVVFRFFYLFDLDLTF